MERLELFWCDWQDNWKGSRTSIVIGYHLVWHRIAKLPDGYLVWWGYHVRQGRTLCGKVHLEWLRAFWCGRGKTSVTDPVVQQWDTWCSREIPGVLAVYLE